MNDDFTPTERKARNRNRALLIGIFALFFGSMLVAGLLRFSGWRPEGMKNHGELLEPPVDLREAPVRLTSGENYPWAPGERIWRIVLAPPADCGAECVDLANDLDKVWRLFGKDADRVHILWLCAEAGCEPPAGAPRPRVLRMVAPDLRLRAALPGVDATPAGGGGRVPVYVIDPNGFVVLRYPPGFDPGGLRADLAKLLKLL